MSKMAYIRCNSGHYFVGTHCPLDGWDSPESHELSQALERLVSEGHEVSIDALRGIGVSEAAMKRTIVIDFGSDSSAFDALVPEGYFFEGIGYKTMFELGLDFL